MSNWQYQLKFQSDWKIGTGTGQPGGSDELVRRDQDGLPFVPAKSMTGVWRDAAEVLVSSLARSNPDWWHWLDFVFGNQSNIQDPDPKQQPTPAAVEIRSALLSDELRDAILGCSNPAWVNQAICFAKMSNSIDPASGQTKKDFLRVEELTRGGINLSGSFGKSVECPQMTTEQSNVFEALLSASAKLIERIGGDRRRGAGKCTVATNLNEQLISTLGKLVTEPGLPPEMETRNISTNVQPATVAEQFCEVPVTILLKTPISISSKTIGNVGHSREFIPGAQLIGPICRSLASSGIDPHSWIQNGSLQIRNATKAVDGIRSEPVPFCLYMEKGHSWHDVAPKLRNFFQEVSPDKQFKQCRTGWLAVKDQELIYGNVAKSVTTHNVINDNAQRPKSAESDGEGGVYSYESIDHFDERHPVAFKTEIVIPKALADDLEKKHPDWWKFLDGRCSLGRSKKDEYGLVSLQAHPPSYTSISTDQTSQTADTIAIRFVSDCLIEKSQRPGPQVDYLKYELADLLDIDADDLRVRDSNDGKVDSVFRVRRTESWQTSWGLPRPSLIGIQAGSCIIFETSSPISQHKLDRLEITGIGKRAVEGFGQVRINDPLLTKPTSHWQRITCERHDSARPDEKPIKAGSDEFLITRAIELSLWNEKIRQAALAFANDPVSRKKAFDWKATNSGTRPPMSQLGNLRNVVAQFSAEQETFKIATAWLKHLEKNDNRIQKWPNKEKSLQQVANLLTKQSLVWDLLEVNDWPVLTETGKTQLKNELWPVAVRAVVFASIQAVKRESESKLNTQLPTQPELISV